MTEEMWKVFVTDSSKEMLIPYYAKVHPLLCAIPILILFLTTKFTLYLN